MHVGGLLIFEAGPLATDEGGVDFERIASYLDQTLTHLPHYRQRLKEIPGIKHHVWVDDEHFHLRYHLRHTALPRPGGERQLKRLAGRIFSQPLDRCRPLWEMWIVEGLQDNRFALIAKVHHAMVDGMGGAAALAGLFRGTPDANFEPTSDSWTPQKQPRGYELLLKEYMHRRAGLSAMVRRGREFLDEMRQGDRRAAKEFAGGIMRVAKSGLAPAPKTSINPKEVSPHRRFDLCSFALADIKTIKNELGGTVNDAMLALCSGALRRFMARRGDNLSILEGFRIMMPVSTRGGANNKGSNQVALTMVPLPLHIEDPKERYLAIRQGADDVKNNSHQAESTALLEEVADLSSASMLRDSVRLAGALRPYNVIITNIPGPPFPLYMLGAKLKTMVPLVPLFHHQALGIALFSYDGTMTIGVGGDWQAIDDLHLLIRDFKEAFDELNKLAAGTRIGE